MCANYLIKFGLRKASSPFDWIFGASLNQRTKLIKNNFKDFLDIENLERQEKDPTALFDDKTNESYLNKKLGIEFLHDFVKSLEFEESYSLVAKKYNRRIERLYNAIKNHDTLLVFISKSKNHTDEEILNSYANLAGAYAYNNVYLLVIENDYSLKSSVKTDIINSHIIKISADIMTCDTNIKKNLLVRNAKTLNKIFSQIKINKESLSFDVIKKFIIKIYIKLVCVPITPVKTKKMIRSYMNSMLLRDKNLE